MLVAWEQPRAVCRLGLFHSAYSNSFVSMNLYDPTRDRAAVGAMLRMNEFIDIIVPRGGRGLIERIVEFVPGHAASVIAFPCGHTRA